MRAPHRCGEDIMKDRTVFGFGGSAVAGRTTLQGKHERVVQVSYDELPHGGPPISMIARLHPYDHIKVTADEAKAISHGLPMLNPP